MEDVRLDQLNLPVFGILSMLSVLAVRSVVYPVVLIKTRLQVQEHGVYKNTIDAVKRIWQTEGLRGFYKGFLTAAIGALPVQGIYVITLEVTKDKVKSIADGNAQLASLVGGAAAALTSSCIGTPVDVIAQRQMLQNKQHNLTNRHYTGMWNAAVTIIKKEGIRGLYTGYGASLITFAPTSAVWWLSYTTAKQYVLPLLEGYPTAASLIGAGFCGMLGASCAAIATNPLDVAKTRLQTQEKLASSPRNIFSMLWSMYKSEGVVKLWTRGLIARCTSMSIHGVMLMTAYELSKMCSLLPQAASN